MDRRSSDNNKRRSRARGSANNGQAQGAAPDEAVSAAGAANQNVARAAEQAQPNEEEERSPLLSSLLDHLVELAHQAGFAESLIEVSKAQLLLEATAGQVPLAAQLYWDDVLARTQQQQQQQPRRQPPARQPRQAAVAAAPPQQEPQQQQQDIDAPLRRRLEDQYDADPMDRPNDRQRRPNRGQADPPGAQENNHADQGGDQEEQPPLLAAAVDGEEASHSVSDDEAVELLRKHLRKKRSSKSNSVRFKRRSDGELPHMVKKRRTGQSISLSETPRNAGIANDFDIDNDEDEGYLSDNDWIWECLTESSRESIPSVQPMDFLWGVPHNGDSSSVASADAAGGDGKTDGEKKDDSDSRKRGEGRDSDSVSNGPVDQDSPSGVQRNPKNNNNNNAALVAMEVDEDAVVAQAVSRGGSDQNSTSGERDADSIGSSEMDHGKHGDGGDDGDDSDDAVAEDGDPPIIPTLWLRACFSFADPSTKMGLSCRPPDEDDIGYLEWKQQLPNAGRGQSNKKHLQQPPYHCNSLTVLPAIVTALMQAGVSVVQGNSNLGARAPQATCQTTQKPFDQLDSTERSRQWEKRLVDALTALLIIAAQASAKRKSIALKRRQRKEQLENQRKHTDEPSPSLDEVPKLAALSASKTSASSLVASLRAKPTKGDNKHLETDNGKWQKLEAKIKLCPTCWWPRTASTGGGQQNQEQVLPSPDEACEIAISYTHICDLRSYVKSNLDSFLSTGGCALFLETVLRIHGKGAVQRMVQLSRQELQLTKQSQEKDAPKDNDSSSQKVCMEISKDQEKSVDGDVNKKACKIPPLIQCKCQERFQDEEQKQRMNAWPDADKKKAGPGKKEEADDDKHGASNLVNDCVSVELMSLLLTGRVYSSWQGWSTSMSPSANLGIGILTDQPGEVGRGLTRPLKPIWIVKGPSQYSVIWLNDRNSVEVLDDHANSFVANMTHWSCWYADSGDQPHVSKTNFRFLGGRRHAFKNPSARKGETNTLSDKENNKFDAENESRTLALLQKRRKADKQAAANRTSSETVDRNLLFTKADLDRVRVHPDDVKYYDDFRLWRYDIAVDEEKEADSKPRGVHWTPFHRLDKVKQMLVETKFGPKLGVILRTRWPDATIDHMEPAKPLPLI